MIGMIVVGHGKFASGLKSNINMITGNTKLLYTIDFEEQDNPETISNKLNCAIKELDNCSGIIIFTDLLNGTPFNESLKYALCNKKIKIVYGVNSSILLTAVMSAESSDDLTKFVMELVNVGKAQIGYFDENISQNISIHATDDL